MTGYLGRLKHLLAEKRSSEAPPKPTEAPFVGFGGDQGEHFSGDEGDRPLVSLPPKTTYRVTDKTDERPFVGFGGEWDSRFPVDEGAVQERAGTAVERIRTTPCPHNFSPTRWESIREGAAQFAEAWGERAIKLGWKEPELFTLVEPFARLDQQGAVWFIGTHHVTAVTDRAITLRTQAGGVLRIYRGEARNHV